MSDFPLPQELLEQILQYVDGKTLLTCKKVSPEFEAAVNYLSETKNIWRKCYLEEKEKKYPYAEVSKLYPHEEGFSHPKDWKLIYELGFFKRKIPPNEEIFGSLVKIGKNESVIEDVQTHGDLILLLVKYNRNFSIYNRILTINLNSVIINKSSKFSRDAMYLTTVKNLSTVRSDAIILGCDSCNLIAVPILIIPNIKGYPKFKKEGNFLTVEHSNGDIFGLNCRVGLVDKGDCFQFENESICNEGIKHSSESFKICLRFSELIIRFGQTCRNFSTFKYLKAKVTGVKHYSNLLILGTDTGMLYMYNLSDEMDLKLLNLECYIWHFDVCSEAILFINVMELKEQFVIVCCSSKYLYQIYMNRNRKELM